MFKIVLLFAHHIGLIDILVEFAYKILGFCINFIKDLIERVF
jgi:hypothetical protein